MYFILSSSNQKYEPFAIVKGQVMKQCYTLYVFLMYGHGPAATSGNISTIMVYSRWYWNFPVKRPGGRLNKKDGLTRYGDSHVKDKTS